MTDVTKASDIIADGLANFANVTKDPSVVEMGAMQYRLVRSAIEPHVRPDDTCAFAVPSAIILPNLRTSCFVAILPTKVVVAWEKGTFRKKVDSTVVDRASVTKASWEVSSAASTRGATLVTIQGPTPVTFALPKGKDELAGVICRAISP